MKNRFTILNLLLLFLVLIIFYRIENIINVIELSALTIYYIFTDFGFIAPQITLALIDKVFFSLLILVLPFIIYWKRKKLTILNTKPTFLSVGIILISILFIFPAVITVENPEFQKDLNVTKLLPPFSSVTEIHKFEIRSEDKRESFIYKKNRVVKNSFDDSIIFADSCIESGSTISYFRNGVKTEILRSDVYETGNRFYLMGTDELGRDVFTRLVFGARLSLLIGLVSVFISFLIAGVTGFWAGYSGGLLDVILNRIAELFLAFPMIFVIIFVAALWGNSLFTLFLLLGFSGWMSLFKIIRTEIKSIKNKDFFITAQQIGLTKYDIAIKEILPVIVTPILVNLFFQFGNVIIAESALSFLGIGSGIEYPSWGAMIKEGQDYMRTGWWLIFLPGFSLIFTLFIINRLGTKINSLINPQLAND